MTVNMKRRLVIYPLVLVALSGLVYGGFVYEADPDAGTLVNSAEMLAQCGSFDKAIEFGEMALRQEPDHRYAHIILGYAYGEKERYGDSLSHYSRAVELTPAEDENRDLLRLYRAEALVLTGRAEEAAQEATEVLTGDPDQYQAYYTLGRARAAQERFEEAAEAYRTVRKLRPDDPDPLLLLSGIEEAQGNLKASLAFLSDAEKLTDDQPGIAIRRALLLLKDGDREGAVHELEEAAKTKLALVRRVVEEVEELESLRSDPRIRALCADSNIRRESEGEPERR